MLVAKSCLVLEFETHLQRLLQNPTEVPLKIDSPQTLNTKSVETLVLLRIVALPPDR